MNTVLQDPATVGTLWKTMSARIRGAKTELQELGEEEDEFTQSTSKLQGLVKSLTGFDIMKDKNTFKDIYDIIIGIGEAWPSLQDIDKASLGEALAGKRGANGLFAVLDNLDTLKSAYETAENSAGSAAKEQANYEKSIQYSLDRLSASAEEFATTFLSSGFVKGIVDIGNAFLGAVTGIDKFAGSLTAVSSILAGGLSLTKDVGIWQAFKGANRTNTTQEILAAGNDVNVGAGGKVLVSPEQMQFMMQYNGELIKGVDKAEAFANANKSVSDSLKNVATKAEDGSYQWQAYTTQTRAAAIASKFASTAINMAIGALAGIAISAIVSGIQSLINAENDAKEASESLASELDTFNSSVNKNASEFSDLAKTYHELSSGVDELGNNIGLTDEQFKTYNDTVSKMVEMDGSIVKFWNNQGQAIIDVGNNLEETNEKYRENLKFQARAKLKGDEENGESSIEDIYENINNYSDTTSKENKTKADQYKKLLDMTNDNKELFKSLLGFNTTVDTLTLGIFNSSDENKIRDQYYMLSEALDEIQDKYGDLFNSGVVNEDVVEKEWKNIIAYIKEQMESLDTEITSREKQFQTGLLTQFESLDEYWEMDEIGVNFVSQLINSIDDEMRIQLGLKTPEEGRVWLENLSKALMDNSDEVSNAYQEILSITESDLPVDQAYNTIMNYIQQLARLLKQDPDNIKNMLGLDSFFEGTVSAYDRAIAIGSNGIYGSVQGENGRRLGNSTDIKNAMAENSINTTEEINKWIEILQKAKSLNEAVEQYNGSVDDAKEKTVSFADAWNMVGVPADKKDEFDSAKKELQDLAKVGKLTAKELSKNSFGQYITDEVKMSAKEAAYEINNLVDSIHGLSDYKSHVQSIAQATQEKKDNKDTKVTSASTLSSLRDSLEVDTWVNKKDIKAWENYEKVMTDATATTRDMKKAQDELATAAFNSRKYMQDITKATDEATKKRMASELAEMGVTNSKEAVDQQAAYNTYQLVNAKLESAEASEVLANGTQDDISALGDELVATGATKVEIISYMYALIKAGSVSLSTAGSIQNLQSLIQQLGYTADAAQKYANYMAQIDSYNSTGGFKVGNQNYYLPSDAAKGTNDLNKTKTEKIFDKKPPKKPEITIGNVSGVNSKDTGGPSSSSDKSSQNDQKQFIDWIERRITRINNIIGKIQAKVENIGKWSFGKSLNNLVGEGKDLANLEKVNKNLSKEIKYYKTLYKMQGEAAREYTKKANQTGKKLPKSVKTKIKSGNYTNKDLKYWFNEYGQGTYDKIQKYIEYYDKAQSAKQGKSEAVKAARDLKIQQSQNYVDLYDRQKSRDEAQEAIAIGYKKQNDQVKEQLENLKQSYKYQEKIAKLNGDTAELERLKAEYEQERRELLYHEIENIKNDFERLRAVNNRRIQDAENLLSVAQAEGRRVNTGWYTSKNINEKNNYAEYVKEREEILKKLDVLKEGTTQWADAMEDLQATENGMAESQKNIADNLTAIRDIIDGVYDEMRENNNFVYEQAQFLAGLERGENINTADRDDTYYRYTNTGIANMAAARTGIGVAQKNQELDLRQLGEVQELLKKVEGMSADEADEYIKNLNNANYSSYEQLITAEKKYTKQWMTDRKAQMEAENSLIDLMKEYYEGQKSYLAEMIEARKKILQEEKDMYDYEKSINEKTKNISTLQKRLAAIQGDNSEAGKARRQQIQSQLDQAQQDLQDTQYERWKTDQEAMLDNLQNQYNDIIDRHLKHPEELLEEASKYLDDNNRKVEEITSSITADLPSAIKDEFSDATNVINSTLPSIAGELGTLNSRLEAYLNKQPDNQKNAEASPDKDKDDPNPSGNESQITDTTEKITSKVVSETSGSLVGNITKSQLTKMVKDAGGKKGKDGKDYTALNALLYKKTGYILSDHDALKKFYKLVFGTTKGFDDKFGKDGALYTALKQAGFKSGGIGRLVKASGEDGLAMVRNGEGFVAPESVNAVQQWMNTAPDMTAMMNMINKNGSVGGTTNIGEMNFELPNVTDARSLIETFQNSKDMQRLLKIGVEDLMGQGKFSNKIFTV